MCLFPIEYFVPDNLHGVIYRVSQFVFYASAIRNSILLEYHDTGCLTIRTTTI